MSEAAGTRSQGRSTPTARAGLWVIVVTYLVLAVTYSVVTPIFEASDEVWHYPFVEHLARGEGLPVLRGDVGAAWRQEGGQPPFYYALGALLTRGIDTSDMANVRRLNPHADTGTIKPDGNVNMVVHTDAEHFPYRGTVLAVHLVRWMSVLMGAVTVVCGHALAREVFPDDPAIVLAATGITAWNPMFLFITSSVNNDALVNALCAIALLLIVRAVDREPSAKRWLVLGAIIALAALTKLSGLAIGVVAGIAVLVVARRRRSWRALLEGALGLSIPVLVVSGWWFARNWMLYRDPTGLNAFLDVVGRRYPTPSFAQLAAEWRGFTMSYWGLFGTLNVAAPDLFYDTLNGLAILGLVGLPLYMWRAFRAGEMDARRLTGLAMVLLWITVLFISFLRWTLTTIASQGRLLFPALTGLSLVMSVGLSGWLPTKGRLVLPWAMAVCLFAGAAVFPWAVIRPAYARPELLSTAPADTVPIRAVFVDSAERQLAELLAAGPVQRQAAPGEQIPVTIVWRALAEMDADYAVFVHLESADGRVIAQRDVYPGLGAFPTSLWQTGDTFSDTYILAIPETTMTPSELTLRVGLYDARATRPEIARLAARSSDGEPLGDSLPLANVTLPSRSKGDIPNPVHVALEDRAALIGYDLDRTSAAPGEAFALTLYWEALSDGHTNYSVFTQVVGPGDAIWAQMDGWPRGGDAPTKLWKRGQRIVDPYVLRVKPDAPPGVYDLQIGMYRDDGTRLTVVDDVGLAKDTRIVLGSVRILPASSE